MVSQRKSRREDILVRLDHRRTLGDSGAIVEGQRSLRFTPVEGSHPGARTRTNARSLPPCKGGARIEQLPTLHRINASHPYM